MERVRFTGAQATMLATLYGKALDATSSRSILHDTMALDTIRQIDLDFTRIGIQRAGDVAGVALRSRHFDGWTREFLAVHPRATVLHLGCGMDARVFRVGPGPGVRWYDVDYPDVIDLRRKIFPDLESGGEYTTVPTPVAPPDWLGQIPDDLPVLVVAEGLTMYLRAAEGHELFRAVVERFPGGQLIFDALSRRAIGMQRVNAPVRRAGATLRWGVDSPGELLAIHPRLRCVSAVGAFDMAGYDLLSPPLRLLARAAKVVPAFRRIATMYRFDF